MFRDVTATLRQILRSLKRTPAYTAASLILLGLGLSTATTLYSLANKFFLQPPVHVTEPSRLVRLNHFTSRVSTTPWSYPDYKFVRDQATSLVGLAAYTPGTSSLILSIGQDPLSIEGSFVSENFFRVLGTRPALGRLYLDDVDDSAGRQPMAVASFDLWQRLLGGRRDAIGRAVSINGHPVVIAGVAPRGFVAVGPADSAPGLWLPTSLQPLLMPRAGNALVRSTGFTMSWLEVIGRLGAGVDLATAQAELLTLSSRLSTEVPSWAQRKEGVTLLADYRYNPSIAERLRRLFQVLLGAAGAVVLISVLNLTLLQFARAATRERETALQLALGASRWRLALRAFLEASLLASAGGLAALVLTFWSSGLAAATLPYRFNGSFGPSPSVFAATLCLCLLIALTTACLAASRSLTRAPSLAAGGHAERERGARLRQGLVAAQIALAVLLGTGAALLGRSLHEASSMDLGFSTHHRSLATLDLAQSGYDDSSAIDFLRQGLEELRSIPGLQVASTVAVTPFSGFMGESVKREEQPDAEPVDVDLNVVGPDFLQAFGIALRQGRDFTPSDNRGGELVAIVSDGLAMQLWGDEQPVGRRLVTQGKAWTVVGVASATRFSQLAEQDTVSLYLPALQVGGASFSFVLVSSLDGASLHPAVSDLLRAVDPRVVVKSYIPLSEVARRPLSPYRAGAQVVGAFSILASVLTAVGLFGVLSLSVAQNRKRIGVQLALGATRARVCVAVLGTGLRLAAWGVPVGAGLYWLFAPRLEPFLFQTASKDLASLVLVVALTLVVITLSSWVPALRAASVSPVDALRAE